MLMFPDLSILKKQKIVRISATNIFIESARRKYEGEERNDETFVDVA